MVPDVEKWQYWAVKYLAWKQSTGSLIKFQLIKVMFYSFRLKLLDVVAEAEAELLKVEAEKEVKFI